MDASTDTTLLPARMVNEFTYCPRLFHLEYVDGVFADNLDTVEGRSVHGRVDREEDLLPDPETSGGEDPPRITRSVTLSSTALGVVAKMDLVETEGSGAIPVDTKKGRVAPVPGGAWDPERVQLCIQGLLLQEHGYRATEGYIYYAASRRRVLVVFDDELVALTRRKIAEAREAAGATVPPPPLVDSPKCPRCSLVGICLPDEVNLLRQEQRPRELPRRLIPGRDNLVPVHVQGHGLDIGKKGGSIVIRERGRVVEEVHIKDISNLSVYGNNRITAQAQRALCEAGVTISWFTSGGWFYAFTRGMHQKNVELRREQFRVADRPDRNLAFAKAYMVGKISNCRTLLMRNHPEPPPKVLAGLKNHLALVREARTAEMLLGIEGNAARLYFSEFGNLLKPRAGKTLAAFDFQGRNRRPPRDPINALLSFGYSVLCRDAAAALLSVGFDPQVGFYHKVRPGRPALALDLMEEFRPLVTDSVVLTVVNNGEVTPDGFLCTRIGCAMKPETRKAFLQAYERRMDTLVTHPVFGYRMSYRRILEVQARLLGRALLGDIPEYPAFTTR